MEDDWRLQGQEKYLQGATLQRTAYKKWSETWDHDHCEFCWAKFSERENDLHEGYCTLDQRHWICDECFQDFKEKFEWHLEEH